MRSRMAGRLGCVIFGLWRCWCAGFVYLHVPELRLGVFVFIWGELAMGVLSVLNSRVAFRIDERWISWFLPWFYAVSLFVIPCGTSADWADGALFFVGAFRMWSLIYLGAGFTSGVA